MSYEKCPVGECEAMRKLSEKVERHEASLSDGKVSFAMINTKLNLVIGILGTVGVALCGVITKLLF